MTTIINYATANYSSASPFLSLSNGIAVVAAVVLLILLAEKVLLDAYEGKPVEYKNKAFVVATLPMLIILGSVVLLRMAQILHF